MDINLTLIGQVGTFLVFWWFVNKYIWPIFSKIASERQRKIADGLSMADSARHKLEEARQHSEEVLGEAKTQANEIVTQAQKQAGQIVESAREEAKKVGALELEHARAQIEQEKRQAYLDLRGQLSALVVEGVEKIVAREINAKDHEKLLQELTEKF
ncbi:F0F1 ATP synthase subunit B [Suttonella ornithocola]|uniref:ATP synthase subunit b n=1 Tax=Suttonella ornithocola TaxID=279832 RepID=A0A380MUR9_9GAMM|nr:F0F1 ATP synthase subunit B [Suttonella ornithocola]SUO96012.1 F-type ATPase subunit b [Suttonella ornithocola]